MSDQQGLAKGTPDRDAAFAGLEEKVGQALNHVRRDKIDGIEVTASISGGLSTTVRMGEVETIEHTRDRGVSVTVYRDGRKGHASSADLSDQSVSTCVDRALEIARFTEKDGCNGLADPAMFAVDFPDLDLWHPRVLDAEKAIARALEIEDAGRAFKRITNSEGATVSGSFGQSVYGNSLGFMGRSSGTRHGQSCVLIAGEGGGMQRDYWYDSRRCFDDLQEPAATGAQAARRTLERMGARKIETTRAPVIFTPEVARSLLGHFIGAISGGALYRNTSFLKDQLGEQLFPSWLSLSESPWLARASGSSAFDAEGVATKPRNIVENGVLQGYVLSSYSARRLEMETTGNAGGIHNLEMKAQTMSPQDMNKDIENGLLVTEVMGQGVSLVTGDYSRGAAGFWIEDGEIAYPVEEITIAGNLKEMFSNIRSVGDDPDTRGVIQSPSMCIESMTIAGS